MALEIVDFPIKHGGSFHSYVNVHQRVLQNKSQTRSQGHTLEDDLMDSPSPSIHDKVLFTQYTLW